MKVYIIEDNDSMRYILKRLLTKNFCFITDIRESASAEEALKEIPTFCPDLLLVDISLPGMDGIELIRSLPTKPRVLKSLVVTGHEIELYQRSALEAGAQGIVSKYDDEQLLFLIGKLFSEICGQKYK